MRLNGTARAILGRRLTKQQHALVEAAPDFCRLGAFWRTLKYGHPWPKNRNRSK